MQDQIYRVVPNFSLIGIILSPVLALACPKYRYLDNFEVFWGPVLMLFADHGHIGSLEYTYDLCLRTKFTRISLLCLPCGGDKNKFFHIFNFDISWWHHLLV